jgi:hypothetical protein
VGTQARLMSNALKRLAGSASKSKCTIIFLNQLRYKVGRGGRRRRSAGAGPGRRQRYCGLQAEAAPRPQQQPIINPGARQQLIATTHRCDRLAWPGLA